MTGPAETAVTVNAAPAGRRGAAELVDAVPCVLRNVRERSDLLVSLAHLSFSGLVGSSCC